MSNTFTILSVQCSSDIAEILMAELSEAGIDTFLEHSGSFEASSESGNMNVLLIEEILKHYQRQYTINYKWRTDKKQNWNKEWEGNYDPVIIDEKCFIRADFHRSDKQYEYEILINPKNVFWYRTP